MFTYNRPMSLDQWLLFLGACTVLNAAPGPDTLYITSRTIAQGRLSGFLSALGVCTGGMLHALAAGLGLSAILATSATAFTVIKWMGALYLIYLGYKALCRNKIPNPTAVASDIKKTDHWKIYFQGVLVDVLNPKTALFFLAFIPQFIEPERGAHLTQFLLLGLLVILNALIIEFFIIVFAHRLTGVLRRKNNLARWLDRGMGTMLIALGLKLASQEM